MNTEQPYVSSPRQRARWAVRVLVGAATLALAAGASIVPVQARAPGPTWWERGTAMEPRFQWNANFGYCGETAFIGAGMLHGQYASQWTARALASPGVPQWRSSSQLLLGVNDVRAARAMRLEGRPYGNESQASAAQFLAWVKDRFLRGDAVIIGVFNNTRLLNEGGKGDPDYDHIVPVFGIGSARPLSGEGYHPTDTITISDNGLHTIGRNIPYLYTYSFASFPRTRTQANALSGPLYSLRSTPPSYGIAITGVLDPDRVTIPVRLTSSAVGEGVQDEAVMRTPPPAKSITLTAHVRIPDPSRAYRVYLYDDFTQVPMRDFNARASRAIRSWTIPTGSGSSWSVTIRALSSDTRAFRAVPVSAP